MDDKIRWIIESTIAPLERTIKRLWILCILLIILLVGTNIGWLIYESQWSYVQASTKVEQEVDEGYNNYIGNNGDIYNGEADSDNDN